MENNAEIKKYPYKLEIGVWMNGRSLPIWVYDKVPDGMRPISSLRELWYGRPFLFPSQLFPGEYMTSYMRDSDAEAVNWMFNHGIPLYVSDKRK